MITFLPEKREYIDNDFSQRFAKYRKWPETEKGRLAYLSSLKADSAEWMNRYKDKTQAFYAMTLLDDFIRSIEKIVERI